MRTDDADELSAPALVLKPQRVKAKWETLSHSEMRDILAGAQALTGQVARAGCGITLPVRFMELDHQIPRKDRGANTINNRILLCGPCNRVKRENLTLSGLIARNKKAGEMTNEAVARIVADKARDKADQCQITMP